MRVILAVALGIATLTALPSASAQDCPKPPVRYSSLCFHCQASRRSVDGGVVNDCRNGDLCCWGCSNAQGVLGKTKTCIQRAFCGSDHYYIGHGYLRCRR
jgi:hypothetical protein